MTFHPLQVVILLCLVYWESLIVADMTLGFYLAVFYLWPLQVGLPQNLLDETAPDGETNIAQNADATELHVKQSPDTSAGTYRTSGSVTHDTRKANVSPVGATQVQAATKVWNLQA